MTTPAPPIAALTTKSRREIFPDLFSKYGLRLIRTLVINDDETEMAERSLLRQGYVVYLRLLTFSFDMAICQAKSKRLKFSLG
jgi:hypothetical protein